MSDAEHMAIRDSMRRFSWARNPYATPDATYGPAQSRVLNAQGFERARDAITAWPGYAPTPLVNLSGIARLAGVAAVHYDDAVRTARATAKAEGWAVIPDTSDGHLVEAPRDVMQGYALMAAEAIEQLGDDQVPTHMFLQAGLAGLLGAADDAGARAGLGLGPGSRVMLFGTEGATDPDSYAGIVGRNAEAVAAQ